MPTSEWVDKEMVLLHGVVMLYVIVMWYGLYLFLSHRMALAIAHSQKRYHIKLQGVCFDLYLGQGSGFFKWNGGTIQLVR